MDFSIENFWKKTFSGATTKLKLNTYDGWTSIVDSDPSYIEASLTLREGYSDTRQLIWLVSAPGAVGKSTFAKEICAKTGAIYLDLATAATVGGNCITGGLVHTGALQAWQAGEAALVIDALDEARLRVTQPAFEDFIRDINTVSKLGKYPILLLGRVGIIEETWTIFAEQEKIEPPIFNIEFFNQNQAKTFIERRLKKLATLDRQDNNPEYPHLKKSINSHKQIYEKTINAAVEGLHEITTDEPQSFVGYAPVLDAVAKVIASETNPARLQDELRRILEGEVLLLLGNEILNREAGKLEDQLRNSISQMPQNLYSPTEQLNRLACRLFGLPAPQAPEFSDPQHAKAYMEAVNSLLPQHPFLDGTGAAPSNIVFAAYIVVAALKSDDHRLRERGESYSNYMKHTPNPFLYYFYHQENQAIPISHVGLLHESIMAKLKIGETIRLSIDEGDTDLLEIEILKFDQAGNQISTESFKSNPDGILHFGRRVANISVEADNLLVTLGTNDTLEFIAPVTIICSALELKCKNIVVKGDPENAVILEAHTANTTDIASTPVVRGETTLMVSWPESNIYPWNNYNSPEAIVEEAEIKDLVRVFRRLIMAFRSHSKGRLARYKGKIEHSRMLKGQQGRDLLTKLQSDNIISLEESMYYLDANALGAKTGASFLDVNLKRYEKKTIDYIKSTLQN